MLHLRHFVMKEEALLKLNKTRQHSSRMHTACLPTICVLVAVVVLNETNRWSDFRSHLLRCRPHVIRMSSTSTYEADAVISPFKNKVWESMKV